MALKRGNLPQMTKDGSDFIGSGGGGDEMSDAPQRATAAQMAGRKIKTPRSRTGGSGFSSTAPSSSFQSFNTSTNNANSSFQSTIGSGGFNFNVSQGANSQIPQFGQSNSNPPASSAGGGFSGSIFSVPGGQTSGNNAPSTFGTQPSTGTSGFNSPSNFNFGGGASPNPFSVNLQSQGPSTSSAPAASSPFAFNATSEQSGTKSFGNSSDSSFPNLFGQTGGSSSNLFNQQGTSAQGQTTQSLFSTSSAPAQNPFSVSGNNSKSGSPSTTPGPFDQAQGSSAESSNVKSVFSQPKPASTSFQSNALFGKDTKPAANNQTADLFASSKKSAADSNPFNFSQKAETKPLFGGSIQSGSNLFNFGKPNDTSSETNSSAAAASATDSSNQQSKPASIFTPQPSADKEKDAGLGKTPLFSNVETAPLSRSESTGSQEALQTTNEAGKPGLFNNLSSSTATKPLFSFNNNQDNSSATGGSLFKMPSQSSSNIFGAATATNTPSTVTAEQSSKQNPTASTPATGISQLGTQNKTTSADNGLFASASGSQNMNQTKNDNMSNADLPNGTPTMPTLNSSAHPKVANGARKGLDSIRVPPPPAHFNDKQRSQWPHVWKLRVVLEAMQEERRKLTGADATASRSVLDSYQSDINEIRDALKRKLPEDMDSGPAAKRVDTGTKKTTALFGAQPRSKGADAFNQSGSHQNDTQSSAANIFGSIMNNQSNTAKDKETSATGGQVDYPKLPNFGAVQPSTSATSTQNPPKFEVPKFGGSSAGASNFLSQFGNQAKKAEAKATKLRQDDDYDSEEEDLDAWAKRDAEEQAAKKAKYEALAKNSSLGFKFSGSGSSANASSSPFGAKGANSTSPAKSIFAKSSSIGGGEETPSATSALFASVAQQKPLFPSVSGGESELDSSSGSVIPAAKPLPAGFSFSNTPARPTATSITAAGGASGLFSSTVGDTPKGGLFSRIEKDGDGKPVREAATSADGKPTTNIFSQSTSSDNTFKGDSSTPIKFAKSLPAGTLAPSVASDTSRATTPGTGAEDTDNAGEEEAPQDKQLDLSSTVAGEEDEDVLVQLRAKGSELVKDKDGKSSWQVRGVGQLKLLCNKSSRKTRLLLRSSPSAKIVFNTQLLGSTKYVASGAKNNTIRVPVVMTDGKISQFIVMVKGAKEAQELAAEMEKNKAN